VGGTVFFDSGVQNTGAVDSDVFAIKWFVNNQEVGAYGSHAEVPASQTVTDDNSQFSWTFDSPGTYSVTYTVDVDNHIEESNEEDNSTTVEVVVGQPSDVAPPPLPPPPEVRINKIGTDAVPGRTLTYFIFVENVGDVHTYGLNNIPL
jgi:subtilase family serine protease